MDIICCIKQVPDTEAVLKIREDGKDIEREGIQYIISPYDEFGVEEALRIKESIPDTSVTSITIGPPKALEALRTTLAMGVDKAIHIWDPRLEGGDTHVTAKILAKAIKDLPFDLIFCGKQAIDDDSSQIGQILAEKLGLPHIPLIQKLEINQEAKGIKAYRQVEGGVEVVESSLPCLFTTQKGLNEPRYPSLPGIMKAKKKPLDTVNLEGLSLSEEEVGEKGSKTVILKLLPPPERIPGRIIEGDDDEVKVKELVKLLRGEAKVV